MILLDTCEASRLNLEMRVDFFFSPGSRYSYLAAVQFPKIRAETGADFRWRAVFSPDLIKRAGSNPFVSEGRRGQYLVPYRIKDVTRWAALLGQPYIEPNFVGIDWRELTLWCAATELIHNDSEFPNALFEATFSKGKPPATQAELLEIARSVALPVDRLTDLVRSGAASRQEALNADYAFAAGAFGVPTFIVEDGELFWGQDHIPLLVHHLQRGE